MRSKQDIREAMWAVMVETGASRSRNVHDRIPDFHGSREAADQVSNLAAWQAAEVIKSNPDRPQRPLRQRALQEGKTVYMAVPRLKSEQCFVELDPMVIEATPAKAATIAGAFRHGRLVFVEEMRPVDLVVSGSVAVNRGGHTGRQGRRIRRFGVRLGGGRGHRRPGHARSHHRPPGPTAGRGLAVDPTRRPAQLRGDTRRGNPLHRGTAAPRGIYWDDLDEGKIAEIPILQKLRLADGGLHA